MHFIGRDFVSRIVIAGHVHAVVFGWGLVDLGWIAMQLFLPYPVPPTMRVVTVLMTALLAWLVWRSYAVVRVRDGVVEVCRGVLVPAPAHLAFDLASVRRFTLEPGVVRDGTIVRRQGWGVVADTPDGPELVLDNLGRANAERLQRFLEAARAQASAASPA